MYRSLERLKVLFRLPLWGYFDVLADKMYMELERGGVYREVKVKKLKEEIILLSEKAEFYVLAVCFVLALNIFSAMFIGIFDDSNNFFYTFLQVLGAILSLWLLGTFIVTDILEIHLRQRVFSKNPSDSFLRKVYIFLWVVFGWFVIFYVFSKTCDIRSFLLMLIVLIIFLIYLDARYALKQLHKKLGAYLEIELRMEKEYEDPDAVL